MPRLDDTAVEEGLQRLPGWERRDNEIVKTFMRKDFAQAMTFVNEVAGAAEAAGHHSDIDIRWNKVILALSSHAEGGLTENDFQLAARIQELDHQGVAVLVLLDADSASHAVERRALPGMLWSLPRGPPGSADRRHPGGAALPQPGPRRQR